MHIIKPYGRSHVEKGRSDGTRRVLRRRLDRKKQWDIEEFAQSHDELVIAQWISTIDKIAAKPAGKNGPPEEQRAFRERLGKAAWEFLEENGLLPGLSGPESKEHLSKLWRMKIAPYGTAQYKARRDKEGKDRPPPSPKGRWYDRFTGGADVANVDAAKVARKIHEDLHVAEHRIGADVPKRQGRVAARAQSIAVNVPRPGLPAYAGGNEVGWTEDDRKAYARAGNVAQEVLLAAQQREAGTRRVTGSIAGAALFEHYARLFQGNGGKPLSISEARECVPQLFNLHMAVKDCYSRILKHHKKDLKEHKDRRRRVSDLLPKTMDELFALVDRKGANRDLNALVRLGKVIHYESAGGAEDNPANVVQNWPADVTRSSFWTSDGQAKIKRNEAFVRVWRHVLALASRTLTDWADPKAKIEQRIKDSDILLANPIELATGELFDNENYGRKLDLLYGNRADFFKGGGDDAFQKTVLRLALQGIAELRHSSFHFKGLGGFANALSASELKVDANVLSAIRKLWETDVSGRAAQLLQTMRGAHCEFFLDESQNSELFSAISSVDPALIPLPRFIRILLRARDAWKGKDSLHLPEPANRADLENLARLCQYASLKLVYERAFRTWLHKREAAILNGFIDRAVDHATAAARALNARGDKDRAEMIVAKAAGLGRLAAGDDVGTFFFNLSAETASEMRVQRGYDSDPDNAREQAGYIESLKCDVVALAFADYLKEAHFHFLLQLSPDAPKPETSLCNLDAMPVCEVDTRAENWQIVLYFLIHLVPVDETGKLLHQMRKWEILAGETAFTDPVRRQHAGRAKTGEVQQVKQVLELYLDMHDAKFEGGAALTGTEEFKELFESGDLFNKVFPLQFGDDDLRIPRRGLREIMRFGHLPALRHVFMTHPIKPAEVSEFFQAEELRDGKSEIARQQERRESLHAKWTRNKTKFSGDDVRAYVEALSGVVRHRHLAAHVTLTDHVRLHRLLMTVLGRLVDYSGLWERDLYFVALALINEPGYRPEQVFAKDGLRFLGRGQIVEALRIRNRQQTRVAQAVADRLGHYFGTVWEQGNREVKIRNNFAHFNMLKSAVDLTACANDARDLMAYDRKLKNAVSQSVSEILYREGLILEWTIEAVSHHLGAATLKTRHARHLGNIRKPEEILENLHGDHFVKMVAALFGWENPRKGNHDRGRQNHRNRGQKRN